MSEIASDGLSVEPFSRLAYGPTLIRWTELRVNLTLDSAPPQKQPQSPHRVPGTFSRQSVQEQPALGTEDLRRRIRDILQIYSPSYPAWLRSNPASVSYQQNGPQSPLLGRLRYVDPWLQSVSIYVPLMTTAASQAL